MGAMYEKTERVTTTTNPETVSIPFPGRCKIHEIAIVRVGGGAIDATLFNRQLVGSALDVDRITENDDGNIRIILSQGLEQPLHDYDQVTLAAGDAGTYDGNHRVVGTGKFYITTDGRPTLVPNSDVRFQVQYIDTDTAHSSDDTGGTMQLNIPAGDQVLYQTLPNLTGTGSVKALTNADTDEIEYVNRDPIGERNIGVNRKLWIVLVGTPATYLIQYRTEDYAQS